MSSDQDRNTDIAPLPDIELTAPEREALLHGWGNFMDDYLDTVKAIIAMRVARAEAEVANAYVRWGMKNEIAAPLDWAWFGEISRRYSPLHEEYDPRRNTPVSTPGRDR